MIWTSCRARSGFADYNGDGKFTKELDGYTKFTVKARPGGGGGGGTVRNDSYPYYGGTLNIDAPGVMANDLLPPGSSVELVPDSVTQNLQLGIGPNGSLSFNAGDSGPELFPLTFFYKAFNASNQFIGQALVTIEPADAGGVGGTSVAMFGPSRLTLDLYFDDNVMPLDP